MRDHPVIESLMRTGYPHEEPRAYQCPVCDDDISGDDVLYTDISGDVAGCDHCMGKTTPRDIYYN